jgi:hypothetical protein
VRQSLHDRGATCFVRVNERSTFLGYEINDHDIEAADQLNDHARAVGFNLMKGLCGSVWVPTEVRFRHERPADIEPYRRFLAHAARFPPRLAVRRTTAATASAANCASVAVQAAVGVRRCTVRE